MDHLSDIAMTQLARLRTSYVYAANDYAYPCLELEGGGGSSRVKLLNGSSAVITVQGTSSNEHLYIYSKGTGNVLINGQLALTGTNVVTVTGKTIKPGGNTISLATVCEGRLTLTSNVPVTTSDVTGASTVYFTPHNGNRVSLYDSTSAAWVVREFSQQYVSTGGLSTTVPHDVFAYWSSGTYVFIESLPWSNATTRATALALQDGVWVKSGDTSRRYLGTFMLSAADVTEDSLKKRFVWNAYNPVERPLLATEVDTTWTYATSVWRPANGNAANCFEYVQGLEGEPVYAEVISRMHGANIVAAAVGIGIDVTAATSATQYNEVFNNNTAAAGFTARASYHGHPGIGYHKFTWLEYRRAGTATFEGTQANQGICGLSGRLKG